MSKGKVLGPEFGYVDLLDHMTYEANIEEEERVKKGEVVHNTVRPSASGKCTREIAYGLMEQTGQTYYEKEIREPNVSRLLTVGHNIEDSLIQHFNKYTNEVFQVAYMQHTVMGFDLKVGKFKDLIPQIIEGSLDWVFISPDGKGLIDCKSKKDKFHKHFISDWDATSHKLMNLSSVKQIEESDKAFWITDIGAFLEELNDPFFEANFWQLNLYACTPWAKRKGIDHAAIIQYNKNDSRLREIRFKPSDRLYNLTKKKFQGAIDAALEGKPTNAPRDFEYGSIKCAFCPYSSDCWSDKSKSAKQEYFDTNFPKKKWPTDVQKLGKNVSEELEREYKIIKQANVAEERRKKAEGAIMAMMLDAGIDKIKFKDGSVYQRKYLKTGRPNWQLRRTKL